MDWIMGHTVSSSSLKASIGDERFTDLDLADEAVIFVKTMEVLGLNVVQTYTEYCDLYTCLRFATVNLQFLLLKLLSVFLCEEVSCL